MIGGSAERIVCCFWKSGESIICPTLYVPDVSVKVEIVNVTASRLVSKNTADFVTFDMKAKLDERERKSQMVILGFNLLLTTKPPLVKFEVEGTAMLTGKDQEIAKMLEADSESKVPHVFQRIYQTVFTTMYLLSSVMNTPPPPQDLLVPPKQGASTDGVTVEVGVDTNRSQDGVTIQADTDISKH